MGFDDALQVFFDDEPLHRMAAGHDGSLQRHDTYAASTTTRFPSCRVLWGYRCFPNKQTNLRGIGVVEHPEDDPGHGVLGVGHVARRSEGGQVVLQGLAEHAVEGDVRPKDVALLPAVFLQLLNLSPEAVQVLKRAQRSSLKRHKTGRGSRNNSYGLLGSYLIQHLLRLTLFNS